MASSSSQWPAKRKGYSIELKKQAIAILEREDKMSLKDWQKSVLAELDTLVPIGTLSDWKQAKVDIKVQTGKELLKIRKPDWGQWRKNSHAG